MAKLTDRQRKQIIAEYVEGDGKVSQQKLADKYHVSRQAISTILKPQFGHIARQPAQSLEIAQ